MNTIPGHPAEAEHTSEAEQPVEPQSPIVPEQPIEAGQPTDVEHPVEPEYPAEPEQPIEAGQPAEAEHPLEPEAPTEPEQPIEAGQPAEAEHPVEPEAPVEPEQPIQAGQPAEAEHPVEPEYPAEPEQPIEAGQPAEAEHPVEPEYPAEPEQPIEAGQPAEEEHPVEPEAPAEPEQPIEAGQPAEEEHPVEPEPPAEPEQPIDAEYPAEEEHHIEIGPPIEIAQQAESVHLIETDQPVEAQHQAETEQPLESGNLSEKSGKTSSLGFFARIKRLNWLFILTVVVPTLLSIIYYGFIASDVYISESRFVVRSPERQTASPLGMLLKGTGFARSQDDSYTVQDFILSRDALKSLNEKLGLEKAFASKEIDIVSRFAGLEWWDKSFEALYKYYQKKVDIQLDSQSSITTLTVRSFTADDSFRINQQLLAMSEALVNQLNELGRQDMIRFATGEVRNAEKAAKAAGLALAIYRNQKSVIDPERQSTLQFQQIAKLQDELLATQAQLKQLQTFARNNPQIPSLQLRVTNLQQEIEAETDRVAGGDRSLAKKAAEYQRLALEREFADKQLGSTLVSLEMARNEAQRKQLYLERIVQPSKPDMAMEPRRVRSILSTFMLGLVVWGVLTMLFAGIREHQD